MLVFQAVTEQQQQVNINPRRTLFPTDTKLRANLFVNPFIPKFKKYILPSTIIFHLNKL